MLNQGYNIDNDIEVKGASWQNGTPSPTTPIAIERVTNPTISAGDNSFTLTDIILRGVGDVKDRIYTNDSKIYLEQNIISELISVNTGAITVHPDIYDNNTTIRGNLRLQNLKKANTVGKILCNKLQVQNRGETSVGHAYIGDYWQNNIYFHIPLSMLGVAQLNTSSETTTNITSGIVQGLTDGKMYQAVDSSGQAINLVTAFKNYINSINPLQFVYQLETPTTAEIDNDDLAEFLSEIKSTDTLTVSPSQASINFITEEQIC